ncbi:hypothetical protein AXF42_Ash016768 [Apostasia shenzhenica]|uniref:Retrotransposon gag domain-containing protein n=1 Tax=Apostasia shenzhenica TaxID=1088818 RepID=A0A2I0AQ97_9ASPA|nr:hypothetical protein AXF42_Ash016768 [Apostasia shenzhenica]
MEARARAEKRIHLKDTKAHKASTKKEEALPRDKKGDTSKPDPSIPGRNFRDRKFPPYHGKHKFDDDSPRTSAPVYIIEEIFSIPKNKGFVQNCGDRQPPQPSEDSTKYCMFHQRYGHLLHECRSFRALINEYIEKGFLTDYTKIKELPLKTARVLFPQEEPSVASPSTPTTSKSSGKKIVLSIFGYDYICLIRRRPKVCAVETPLILSNITSPQVTFLKEAATATIPSSSSRKSKDVMSTGPWLTPGARSTSSICAPSTRWVLAIVGPSLPP